MARVLTILVALGLSVIGEALTPSSYFSTVDQGRLQAVFEAAQPFGDIPNAHYSIMGLNLLGATIPKSQEACSFLKSKLDTNSVESLFHASSAAKLLGNCQLSASQSKQFLSDAIKADATVATIYYAFFALKNLGLSVDAQKVNTALQAALKTDDSPLSNGYSFLIAAELGGDVKKYFDTIEDIIAQADEVDNKYAQFEGGLFTTSVVINGAYKLAEKFKSAPTISEEKVVKFTNYFLSRKHVHQLKAASHTLAAIKTLTSNTYHIPVAVTLASSVSVSDSAPTVQVRVTNLLSAGLGKLTVTADSARHLGDDAVILSKKPFTASASDSSLYELNLMNAKPSRGFYKLTISIAPQKPDKRLLGTSGAEVEVKVTTKVTVENVEIGVADKDQSSAAKTTKLQHPNKAATLLEADHHQKVTMKFQLKDQATSKALQAHQTFVRLTNQKSKQEITFVAEPDTGSVYKFDLDVGSSAKDFGHLSGKYTMDLIIGDAVIQNPIAWTVADIELTFPEGTPAKGDATSLYKKSPEIKHMFREPEKRPPAAVSNIFTVLVFAPIIILLILWLRLGVNISNFPLSLSAVGFHAGLGAIFFLYYLYWVNLNMFDTLRYLGLLGIPTFIFGNRLLSGIAAKRK